jgi:hypothetical protein
MSPDSLKRLLVLLGSAALLALQPLLAKLGVAMSPEQAHSVAALAIGYLLQSGAHSALTKVSQNKAFAAVTQDASKALELLKLARSAQPPAPAPAAK